MKSLLTIGEVSRRVGVAPSALRFYEQKGLLTAARTAGNQRLYPRAVLRRVSVIKVAQSLGLTLGEIHEALDTLPGGRTPTKRDWERLSKQWRSALDARITSLERLRDNLTSCIGCGCLSLKRCALYNPDDTAAEGGPGPQYLHEAGQPGRFDNSVDK